MTARMRGWGCRKSVCTKVVGSPPLSVKQQQKHETRNEQVTSTAGVPGKVCPVPPPLQSEATAETSKHACNEDGGFSS